VIAYRYLRSVLALLLPVLAPLCAAAAPTDMQRDHPGRSAPVAHGLPVALGDLLISDVWARATVPSVAVGAVYFIIENRGPQADTLIDASCPQATSAMFHRTTQTNGVSHMEPVDSIAIPPGGTVKIEPGGLHLMLMGLKQPLKAGMLVPLTLRFRRAGKVVVRMQIVPLDA